MKLVFRIVLICLITCITYFVKSQDANDWENPAVFGINKEKYHVAIITYADLNSAIENNKNGSPFYKLLNGNWKFHYVLNPASAPADFYKPDYNISNWKEIKVPGSIELQGFGQPIFKNIEHPFKPANPPFIPLDDNPVGSYRTNFSIPQDWQGRQVFINFAGVESAFYIWVNGQKVGYSENSYCAHEFNITPYIKAGNENILAVQVYRYSDGSYLEDQDYWRLSGIFRDVYVYSKPNISISDYYLVTDLDENYKDADLKFNFQLRNLSPKPVDKKIKAKKDKNLQLFKVIIDLYDANKNLVFKDSTSLVSLKDTSSAKIDFSKKLINPMKWNSEQPYLYTLILNLKDQTGKTIEVLSSKVGVREVEWKKGILTVNGVRVMIRGVNRHEHDPYLGRYNSKELMIKDIKIMKQFNINAVRTCHYTNDPQWLDLCDEYGIYLCAEANLESHAFWSKFSLDPEWKESFLDRCKGNIERDKNHPSVIIWSLGNESGFGPNHVAMSDWIHKNDPTRPVHYNPADRDPSVDIVAPMYPTVEAYEATAKSEKRPVIMCEYAHAMGNSVGNLKEYWDPTYSIPNAQGGYIWDWIDQGFIKKDKNGKEFIANGGEMNDPKSETFTAFDGLVLADRTVQPELNEYKYIIQPVKISAIDLLNGKFKILNRYESNNLNILNAYWELKVNGKSIQKGDLPKLDIPAGAEKEFSIPFEKLTLNPGLEYFMNISLKLDNATIWADKGHEVAYEQFKLPNTSVPKEYVWDKKNKDLKIKETPEELLVSGKEFVIRLSRKTGYITGYQYNNKELMKTGPEMDLWRAPTDNDEMWWNPSSSASKWRSIGLNNLETSVTELNFAKQKKGMIEISALQQVKSDSVSNILQNRIIYHIFPNGEIFINNNISFDPTVQYYNSFGLPRIGMQLILPAEFENYNCYGKGPFENYIDRNHAAKIDFYHSTVTQQYFPYSRPQTTGNKTEVKWLSLTNKEGLGLAVIGQPSFEATALHYSENDLFKKSSSEIKSQDQIFLHIDYRQRGLGGASCGPDTRQEYNVKIVSTNYTFRIKPIQTDENAPGPASESPFVIAPEIFPKKIVFQQNETIELKSVTKGSEIHYTLDGKEPTLKSPLYSSPIVIEKKIRLKAKAFKNNLITSPVVTETIEISKQLFELQQIKYNQHAAEVEVSIAGFKKIGIIVTDPDQNMDWDHIAIADARIIRKDGSMVFLTRIKPIVASQPYGSLSSNKSIDGNPIKIAGKLYEKGLGTHAPAEIWYEINADSDKLKLSFGVDDENGGKGSGLAGLKILGIE